MSNERMGDGARLVMKRRSGMLGLLVFGLVGAWMIGACGGGNEPEMPTPALTGRTPEPDGRVPVPRNAPPNMASGCPASDEEPCMRYRTELVGDPNMNEHYEPNTAWPSPRPVTCRTRPRAPSTVFTRNGKKRARTRCRLAKCREMRRMIRGTSANLSAMVTIRCKSARISRTSGSTWSPRHGKHRSFPSMVWPWKSAGRTGIWWIRKRLRRGTISTAIAVSRTAAVVSSSRTTGPRCQPQKQWRKDSLRPCGLRVSLQEGQSRYVHGTGVPRRFV